MRQFMTTLLVAGFLAMATQAITPIYLWELANVHGDLTAAPSNTDLIEGFPELGPGAGDPPFQGADPVLSNQVINESINYNADDFYPAIVYSDPNHDPNDFFNYDPNDLRDPNLTVLALLMDYCAYRPTPDDILFGVGNPSNGFLPGTNGSIDDLNNGVIGPTTTDGVLRDFGRASLVVRYGFSTPTDIGVIRVIGGNINDSDTRTFHHYDVWVSTDGLGAGGSYELIAQGVKSGEYGYGNINDDGPDDPATLSWFASMTEVRDNDSKTLAAGVTDIRLVFYCTGSGSNIFTDPWNGSANEDDTNWLDTCNTETDAADIDGRKRAFIAPVLQEIDVLGPDDDTPWGDIDYNGQSDMLDFAAYQGCSADLNSNGCYRFDQNENSSLDGADIDAFDALMNGPLDPTSIPDQRINGLDGA